MIFKDIKKMIKFVRDEKGAAIVEFALVAILVFGLLFAIVDLGMMFYVNLTMQHAVREGARFAITGNDEDTGLRESVKARIRNSSVGLCNNSRCPDSKIHFFVLESGSLVALPTDPGDPQSLLVGAPQQIIVIRVDYSWPLLTPLLRPFFPNGNYNFTVGATMRNEPF
jgi:Flp pilus assembly protein TadG